MKANFKNIAMLLLIVCAVVFAVTYFSGEGKDDDAVVYSDIVQLFEDDLVTSFVVDESGLITIKHLVPVLDEAGGYVIDPQTGKISVQKMIRVRTLLKPLNISSASRHRYPR